VQFLCDPPRVDLLYTSERIPPPFENLSSPSPSHRSDFFESSSRCVRLSFSAHQKLLIGALRRIAEVRFIFQHVFRASDKTSEPPFSLCADLQSHVCVDESSSNPLSYVSIVRILTNDTLQSFESCVFAIYYSRRLTINPPPSKSIPFKSDSFACRSKVLRALVARNKPLRGGPSKRKRFTPPPFFGVNLLRSVPWRSIGTVSLCPSSF